MQTANTLGTDAKITVTRTIRKTFTIDETQLENILEEWAKEQLHCLCPVTVSIRCGDGFVREVEFETETTEKGVEP